MMESLSKLRGNFRILTNMSIWETSSEAQIEEIIHSLKLKIPIIVKELISNYQNFELIGMVKQ